MTWRVILKAVIIGIAFGSMVWPNTRPRRSVVGCGLISFESSDYGFPAMCLHYHSEESQTLPRKVSYRFDYEAFALNCVANLTALAGSFLFAVYLTRRGNWRLQIHLSTIILLVIASGIALGLNMQSDPRLEYGWPYRSTFLVTTIVINLIYNGLMLIALGALCERFSRKQTEAGVESSFLPAQNT